jgi:HAD superfamily hydrolase (TIGR01509 family)
LYSHREHEYRYFLNEKLQKAFEGARVVVFDMNGLIINDEGIQLESVNRVLSSFHIHVDRAYWIEGCVGKRADQYLLKIFSENGIAEDAARIRALVEEKNCRYEEMIVESVGRLLRPGVRALVGHISKRADSILALATSALRMELEIIMGENGLDLIRFFRFILTGEDVKRSKPDPEIYEKLVRLTQTPKNRCLVLEDSGPGVKAAHAAGVPCIAVPNEYTAGQDFSHAEYVISDLTKRARILYHADLEGAQ